MADDGEFVFESVDDETKNEMDFIAYPILTEAFIQADEQGKKLTPEDICAAVMEERRRVQAKPVMEPSTEIGKLIKKETLLPTTVIDRMVRTRGRKVLRRFRSRRVN